MTDPRISDIPTIKKALEDIRNIKTLKAAMPFMRPILKLLGGDVTKIDEAFSKVQEMERIAAELATIPDRFSDLFAPHGWILYDLMNLEVAKAAIQKAEAGDVEGAEADLVNYYDAETVRWQLQTMVGVRAFRPRMSLAQKALTDYCEERYHACIPVVLALLDGMVNELHEKRRGFFAEGVSLEAWDSIAAHSKGLNQLVRIMTRMRQTTTTEQITVPFRNGILHGMDLGYDNKIVAAKSWAALFAARDWALKAERGLLTAPPQEPKKTWREIFKQLRDNEDEKKRLEAWKPRTILLGENIPITGEPNAFEAGMPEHKLAEFLVYWQARNYGYMAKCLSLKTGYPATKLPARIREDYASKRLKSFEFVEINDYAAAVTDIQTKLVYEEGGNEIEKLIKFHLINEDTEARPTVRGKPSSTWVVYNWYGV